MTPAETTYIILKALNKATEPIPIQTIADSINKPYGDTETLLMEMSHQLPMAFTDIPESGGKKAVQLNMPSKVARYRTPDFGHNQ